MVRKVVHLIGTQLKAIYQAAIFFFPGEGGNYFRYRWVIKNCKKVGSECYFEMGMRFENPENIEIGESSSFGRNAFLQASQSRIKIGSHVSLNVNAFFVSGPGGDIGIGDNVIIGPNVVIRAVDHNYVDLNIPIRQQGHIPGKIFIGNDVWIGGNVVITKDVMIGDHSIVGAGSVVTKDVEPFSIVGGVPAEFISKRI
jgi:galactoside O-acetyltransferase